MSFYHKSLKYKIKYIQLVGGNPDSKSLNSLPNDVLTKISNNLTCGEIVKMLRSGKIASDFVWEGKILPSEYSNHNPLNTVCTGEHANHEICNQYVNKCKKEYLMKEYNNDNLDQVLYFSIKAQNVPDVKSCISLGANCNFKMHNKLMLIFTFIRKNDNFKVETNNQIRLALIEGGATPIVSFTDSEFINNSITWLEIPDTVQSIDNFAFKGNRLSVLNIPDTVQSIGAGAFMGNNLQTLTIPDTIQSIGEYAFDKNQLTTINFNNTMHHINNGVFGNNLLTTLTIPDTIQSIGIGAFGYNRLLTLVIPNTVESIGDHAFESNRAKLINISIPLKFKDRLDDIFGAVTYDRTIIYT